MSLPYCEKFGFDEARIRQRLQWLEFSDADHELARRLQAEVIRPNITAIVDDFYAWMGDIEEVGDLLRTPGDIAHLKVTQTAYLRSLGVDFHQADYFESRLQVGQTHAWIGLSLSLYNCAYFWLSQFIVQRIVTQITDHNEQQHLQTFLHKIVSLDISLAIETYHKLQIHSLEDSLARAQQQQDRLRAAASTDSLTGLPNHDAIITELKHALADVDAGKYSVAVVMADLDHFKRVNDSLGHLVGDKVLSEVAHRMRSALRGLDRVGRYGGEEFLMILYNATPESMHNVAERVRQRISAHPIKSRDTSLNITLSMGVTLARRGESVHDAIARADAALYAAKEAGRDCIIIH